MMRAETLEELGTRLRWAHAPAWPVVVSLAEFARRHLRSVVSMLAVVCAVGGAVPFAAAQQTIRTDPTYLIDTWETENGLPENSATAMV